MGPGTRLEASEALMERPDGLARVSAWHTGELPSGRRRSAALCTQLAGWLDDVTPALRREADLDAQPHQAESEEKPPEALC